MRQNEKLTRTQTLMAANAPIFIKRAMVEGHPAEGVLPSGQVAGLIDDLPSCKELVERIMAEAERTLVALGKEGIAIAS
jgi:NAD(P)H-dependent flavin oxidoreductase YrpB (nitropropane dioxygenase family)